MKHFLLFYDVEEDFVTRREPFRNLHLKHAWAAHERGELLMAGALADPVDGAVLLFQGDSSQAATTFAQTDPYVVNGLITTWRVRQWTTVAGEKASTPVRPTNG